MSAGLQDELASRLLLVTDRLLSFAPYCSFILSWYNLGVRGITHPNVIVGMALGFGGLAQLLAGMWEVSSAPTPFSPLCYSLPLLTAADLAYNL